jgi:hypothetical protein
VRGPATFSATGDRQAAARLRSAEGMTRGDHIRTP